MDGTLVLQVIGGGKMGEALLGGLVARGWAAASSLGVVEPSPARREALASAVPGVVLLDAPVVGVDALVAVKPDVVPAVCAGLDVPRVLSIAAGVRCARIEAAIGAPVPVVRAMPNTPSLVGEGAAAIAPGAHAGPSDLAWAAGILGAVGTVVEVGEDDLDAVTGVSGSGPAYVFLLAEALRDAAIAEGLTPDVAGSLVAQTLRGASILLAASDESAEQLRSNVTSPNGTTAAGIAVFEAGGFRALVADVVHAAVVRSRELGAG
jgi:pyrroline-5-carboxylate reductase